MEDWVRRALDKWPNVPALFGWLRLDRRGRWRIRGELISRPQIIDTICRNYGCDPQGRWYFQNGPQRGYVSLDDAPLVLRCDAQQNLCTHLGQAVQAPKQAFLDEEAALWLETEHGPAKLEGEDLHWALERIREADATVDETGLARALAQPSGTKTNLSLHLSASRVLPLQRLDTDAAPRQLGFVRDPQPMAGEPAQA